MRFLINLGISCAAAVAATTVNYILNKNVNNAVAPMAAIPAGVPTTETSTDSTIIVETIDC